MAIGGKKFIALIIILASGALFAATLWSSTFYVGSGNDVDTGIAPVAVSTSSASGAQSSQEAGVPARLRIPSIDLDVNVVDVGLGKTGNMAVPYTYTDTGWYRYGPKPGEVGSAVIDGHVDNGLGTAAVFARLGELKAGDDLYIDTKEGNTLHFKVEEAASYNVADVPLQKLFNRADEPRLNLVTCDGVWLADQKMYDQRHVVYAVLVD